MTGTRQRTRRGFLRLAGAAGAGLGLAGCTASEDDDPQSLTTTLETTSGTPPPNSSAPTIYVGPDGTAGGAGTRDDPRASIQEAVNVAEPGDTVHVLSGEYREYVVADRSGEPDAPITITGPREAVIRPPLEPQEGRPLFHVAANHVHLTGCTFDGLANTAEPERVQWYSGELLVRPQYGEHDHLTNVKIMPAAIGNVRAAMVVVNRATDVEIGAFEVIGPAGVQHLYGDEDGHHGEIVYLADQPFLHEEEPWESVFVTRNVRVHHIDNSAGHPHAELVDASVATRNVTIEYCTDAGGSGRYLLPGHHATSETAINLLGSESTVRWNRLENGHGQGIEVGWSGILDSAAEPEDMAGELADVADETGTENAIYGNRIVDNDGLAIQYLTDENEEFLAGRGPDDQQVVCGNEYNGETHGEPDSKCPEWVPQGDSVGHQGGKRPWEG